MISILFNKPFRIICQISPRIRCSLPSTRSDAPIFTVDNPRDLAEEMTRLLFSVIWNALIGLGPLGGAPGTALGDLDLLRTRSSIVSGTASLMSFDSTSPSDPLHQHEEPAGGGRRTYRDIRQRFGTCRSGRGDEFQYQCPPRGPTSRDQSNS